jgi:hypothetical protein
VKGAEPKGINSRWDGRGNEKRWVLPLKLKTFFSSRRLTRSDFLVFVEASAVNRENRPLTLKK